MDGRWTLLYLKSRELFTSGNYLHQDGTNTVQVLQQSPGAQYFEHSTKGSGLLARLNAAMASFEVSRMSQTSSRSTLRRNAVSTQMTANDMSTTRYSGSFRRSVPLIQALALFSDENHVGRYGAEYAGIFVRRETYFCTEQKGAARVRAALDV